MVIEYAGELIRSTLTDKRERYYDGRGIGCYMFKIDDNLVVDATMRGNAARFINHACEVNFSCLFFLNSTNWLLISHFSLIAIRRWLTSLGTNILLYLRFVVLYKVKNWRMIINSHLRKRKFHVRVVQRNVASTWIRRFEYREVKWYGGLYFRSKYLICGCIFFVLVNMSHDKHIFVCRKCICI